MTHEETNLRTRKALADALKEKMQEKPLSRITVSELITMCHVNRKTFYYHFEDIYDLLKWILEEEAVTVVRNFDPMQEFEDCLSFILDYVDSNAHILCCAYDSMGREEMRRFLVNDFSSIIRSLIDRIEESEHLHAKEDYKEFLCGLFTEALAGELISWFKNRRPRSKEDTIAYLALIEKVSVPALLRSGPQKEG